MRLDPKFALGWALLSYIDARGYITRLWNQPLPSAKGHGRQLKRRSTFSQISGRLSAKG